MFAAAGEADDKDRDFVEDIQRDGKQHLVEGIRSRCDDGGGDDDYDDGDSSSLAQCARRNQADLTEEISNDRQFEYATEGNTHPEDE